MTFPVVRHCRPEEEPRSWELERKVWAPFNWEAGGAEGVDYFPEHHFVAECDGRLVGTIDGCPFRWSGASTELRDTGWVDMVRAAAGMVGTGPDKANWIGAIGTSIDPAFGGMKIAPRLLKRLREHAIRSGYQGVIAPVRPMMRSRLPYISLKEYVNTRLDDGQHFDPWIRVHESIGGKIINFCESSAKFVGKREDWERWTGTRLPSTGKVLAPWTVGVLELDAGVGRLVEPSVWMVHAPPEATPEPASGIVAGPAESA